MMSSIELESTYTDAESFLFIYTASDTSPLWPIVSLKVGHVWIIISIDAVSSQKTLKCWMHSPLTHRKYTKKAFFVRKIWGGGYASGHFCYNKKENYIFFITNQYLIDIPTRQY